MDHHLQWRLVDEDGLPEPVLPKELDVAPNDGAAHRRPNHRDVREIERGEHVAQVCSKTGDVKAPGRLVAVAVKAQVDDIHGKALGEVLEGVLRVEF